MRYAAVFALVLVACGLTMVLLARARWAWHAPRIAIVCWQSIGLGLGLALIGLPLALGLAPYGAPTFQAVARFGADLVRDDLPVGVGPAHLTMTMVGLAIATRLLWVTPACLANALRAQRRHRELLTLVGRVDPAAPGALVLDHPSAAAYCLPGIRPTVVVSAGTLNLLEREELEAVLSHERAHADERHDLVLLPFTALRQVLPAPRWLRHPARWLQAARDAVALLVEMRADDRARDQHADAPLVAALQRFATAPAVGTPAGALGAADRALAARVQRLRDRRHLPWARSSMALVVSAVLASVPAGLFVLPG